ncbi:MAG: type II toxin-antitoxin system HicB family antitoxin [Lachnospira sp.]
MKCVYPALIAKHENDYLAFVPDLDIYTEGTSFADAIEMARDAIGLKGIDYEDDKKALPEASNAEQAVAIAKQDTEIFDYSKGILTYIDVDFSEYRKTVDTRSVRRNVTLPCWLNNEADKAGVNVSGILQEALMKVLNVSRPY